MFRKQYNHLIGDKISNPFPRLVKGDLIFYAAIIFVILCVSIIYGNIVPKAKFNNYVEELKTINLNIEESKSSYMNSNDALKEEIKTSILNIDNMRLNIQEKGKRLENYIKNEQGIERATPFINESEGLTKQFADNLTYKPFPVENSENRLNRQNIFHLSEKISIDKNGDLLLNRETKPLALENILMIDDAHIQGQHDNFVAKRLEAIEWMEKHNIDKRDMYARKLSSLNPITGGKGLTEDQKKFEEYSDILQQNVNVYADYDNAIEQAKQSLQYVQQGDPELVYIAREVKATEDRAKVIHDDYVNIYAKYYPELMTQIDIMPKPLNFFIDRDLKLIDEELPKKRDELNIAIANLEANSNKITILKELAELTEEQKEILKTLTEKQVNLDAIVKEKTSEVEYYETEKTRLLNLKGGSHE